MSQPLVKSLEKMLDYCTQKQKVISKNIANIGTEGYQREDIQFSEVFSENLTSNLRATQSKHISSDNFVSHYSEYEITRSNDMEKLSGTNNVDIDTEMAEMAENQLKFKFAARKMSDYFKSLQNVIKGGTR